MKLALCQINPLIADFSGNLEKIKACIESCKKQNVDLALFPELATSGYPPQDLLFNQSFLAKNRETLSSIQSLSKGLGIIIGSIRERDDRELPLANSAYFFHEQKCLHIQDKTLLPNYDVFNEKRYFSAAHESTPVSFMGKKLLLTICEDIWFQEGDQGVAYKTNLFKEQEEIDLIINLSASPFSKQKWRKRLEVASDLARMLSAPIAFINQVGGNDSLIFDGKSFVMDKQGHVVLLAQGFKEDLATLDLKEEKKTCAIKDRGIDDLMDALILGLSDYFKKQGFQKALLGLSGGIDSAVTLALAKEALGKENVLAVSLPSRYTSKESRTLAKDLAENLGVKLLEIPIDGPHKEIEKLLSNTYPSLSDVTGQNIQSRIRGLLLMALSNQEGSLLLSCGNKSELALGYTTLYGDLCGGLAILADVLKTEVYALARHINCKKEIIPQGIIERAPSAELKPNQKDQDTLPPYELIDSVLTEFLEKRASLHEIEKMFPGSKDQVAWIVKTIYANEFKRRQGPIGLKVSEKAFSAGYHFPIVHAFKG